ncbi:MAG: 16S rRNA (guanine(527)-N(7))-methyltransferase RsmG [Lachnospiraceae bacterium]|nr:16S rRNA (guanine(527)-N(7))-methyltransferase RsmG [Lachnospiraceae bacterium]
MSDYNTSVFEASLCELGFKPDSDVIDKYITYYRLLTEWNQKINLTAITEFDEVFKKHFIDCLSIVKAFDLNKINSLIDVGCGAGFPGLVLKIMYPHLSLTLLDSLNKRINFLKLVADELNLTDIDFIHGRSEDFGRNSDYREKFDVCTSRAVANMSTLSELCIPFVKVGGKFIAYKGDCLEELNSSQNALKILGCDKPTVVSFNLPSSDMGRTIVLCDKIKPCPKTYPRKAGTPSKSPIS